jgi:hypothetical protein
LIEIEQFTVAQARKSTLLVAGVLALISGWQLYRHRPTASMVLAVIVGVLLVCAAIPALAVRFNKWWMTLAGVLGYVNSRIILSVLFYLLMTPVCEPPATIRSSGARGRNIHTGASARRRGSPTRATSARSEFQVKETAREPSGYNTRALAIPAGQQKILADSHRGRDGDARRSASDGRRFCTGAIHLHVVLRVKLLNCLHNIFLTWGER